MTDTSHEGSSKIIKALFSALEQELAKEGFSLDFDCINDLLTQIHLTPIQSEKEKLRQKDQAFVNTIGRLKNHIDRAGWMPQGTAFAFRLVIIALSQVESILWELKGEQGPPPQPQPPRPPSPGPRA